MTTAVSDALQALQSAAIDLQPARAFRILPQKAAVRRGKAQPARRRSAQARLSQAQSQRGCAHAAPYLLVLIFCNSTFTVDDFCPRLRVAKRRPPPTTITINAPTRTPSTPTPPLPSAMVLSSLHQQGGYAARVVLVPRLIFCADRQFFRGEQGDQAAALVGNDDLFLYARGGEAVGCRAIGFDLEHHSFLDFGRVVHRYDAGDDRPLVQV